MARFLCRVGVWWGLGGGRGVVVVRAVVWWWLGRWCGCSGGNIWCYSGGYSGDYRDLMGFDRVGGFDGA